MIIVYPFGPFCPKCKLAQLVALSYCERCEDCVEVEHVHKICFCGFKRIEKCADNPDQTQTTSPPAEQPATKPEGNL